MIAWLRFVLFSSPAARRRHTRELNRIWRAQRVAEARR